MENEILKELKITELEDRVEFGVCGGVGDDNCEDSLGGTACEDR